MLIFTFELFVEISCPIIHLQFKIILRICNDCVQWDMYLLVLCASGQNGTFDLRMTSQVFYHCATDAGHHSDMNRFLCWHCTIPARRFWNDTYTCSGAPLSGSCRRNQRCCQQKYLSVFLSLCGIQTLDQGSLTEGEGSVLQTSSLRQVVL